MYQRAGPTVSANLLSPDFIGIGAMRAGTSWYARNLGHHPDIVIGMKEVHFFDRRLEECGIPLLSSGFGAKLRYSRWFLRGKLQGKVTGEYTPAYAILPPERVALVKSWMPRVKLLFTMRDPVERAWSHARKDFPQFHGKRVEEASRDELSRFFRLDGVVKRGDYATCLENWLAHFPREQFHITYLEEVQQRPMDVLRETFDFLGVDPQAPFDDSEVGTARNSRPPSPIPAEIQAELRELTSGQTERLRRLIGAPPPWAN